MSRLIDLLHALDPRARAQYARRLATLIESNRALGRRVRALEDAVAGLVRLTSSVQHEHQQMATLRREDESSAARLAALGPGMGAGEVGAHVRAAVETASIAADPCPHLVVYDVLPPALYQAILATLPPRTLLDERGPGTRLVPAPPKLAPVATIVVWDFVIEEVVRPALAPAISARLGLDAKAALSACQLVLREAGSPFEAIFDSHSTLSGLLFLAQPGDGADFGVTLCPAASDAARTRTIPFTANTLVAVATASGWLGTAIPADAPGRTMRYGLQFQLH